jgi:AcrR family transcriptional regulator
MTGGLESYPRGAQKILLAAERLIAERGTEGFSLREVLRLADQSNNSAIYYHFGSKDGLIRTIYDLRQAEIDVKRRERMTREKPVADGDAEGLLALLLLPVFDTFEGEARETFARFILHLILSEGEGTLFAETREPETTHQLNLRLRNCYPLLPKRVFKLRYTLGVAHFLQGVVLHWRLIRQGRTGYATTPTFWAEMLQACIALLELPYPPADTGYATIADAPAEKARPRKLRDTARAG